MATIMTIDTFDFVSDLIALIQVKNNAHFALFVIYSYLVLTVFMTLTYCYVAYHYGRDAYTICKQLKYGMPNIFYADNDGDNSSDNNANVEADYMSISRGIGQEKVSSLLIFIQDVPMIAFNCILILSCNFRDNLMILSLMLNMVNFGYNLSSRERLVALNEYKSRLDSFLKTIKYIRKKAKTLNGNRETADSSNLASPTRTETLKLQRTYTNIEKIIRQMTPR
eukprot:257559_1